MMRDAVRVGKFACCAAGAALVATVAACGGAGSGNQVEIHALWYGKNDDGSVAGGTTTVAIAARLEAQPSPFSVDLTGLEDEGAGPQWTSATASAAVVALLSSGRNPETTELSYALRESIDGPSAGALLAVGSRAAIEGVSVANDSSMTGTILPDGSVGPVGGIPAKIRAAAKDGIKHVYIPASQKQATDPNTNRRVDVAAVGQEVGVEVTPVESVYDAYPGLTGTTIPAPAVDVPALDPALVTLLEHDAKVLISRVHKALKDLPDKAAPFAGTKAAEVEQQIGAKLRQASKSLAGGDAVSAFAQAGLAGQDLAGWSAGSATITSGSTAPTLEEAIAQADVAITKAVAAAATARPTMLEQLTALADANSWAADAFTQVQAAKSRLPAATHAEERAALASTVAQADFQVDALMPTAVKAAQVIGWTAIADEAAALAILGGYADVMGYAGDANMTYADSLVETSEPENEPIKELADQAQTTWQTITSLTKDLPPTAKSAVELAAGMSYFIAASNRVAGLASASSGAAVFLDDDQQFRHHVDLANMSSDRQAKFLAEADLDSSYMRWNNGWGSQQALATGLSGDDDRLKIDGLGYQWFALLQGQLLNAIRTTE